MFNRVILIGRVGRDPEPRYMESGERGVLNFTLATNRRYQDRNGQWQDDTQWHNIVFWGSRNLDRLAEKLRKGTLVMVEGEIRYRKWQDRNGVTHIAAEIYAFRVAPLEKRTADTQTPEPAATEEPGTPIDTPSEEELPQTTATESEEELPQVPPEEMDETKDDLPF